MKTRDRLIGAASFALTLALAFGSIGLFARTTDFAIPRRGVLSCTAESPYIYYNATDLLWHCTSTQPVVYNGATLTVTALEANRLAGITPGAVVASKYVAVGASREIATLGPITGDGDVSIAKTITAATHAVERLVRSEITLNPTSSVAMSPATDSLAGVRGGVTLTSGKSMTAGFLYGVQGKIVADGATFDVGSAHIAGLYGQFSGNGMTVTSGHVAIGILSGQNLPTSANVDGLYLESGGGTINAVIKAYVKATYAFDLSGEAPFAVNTAGTGAGECAQTNGTVFSKALAVKIDGTNYWIPLCTAK